MRKKCMRIIRQIWWLTITFFFLLFPYMESCLIELFFFFVVFVPLLLIRWRALAMMMSDFEANKLLHSLHKTHTMGLARVLLVLALLLASMNNKIAFCCGFSHFFTFNPFHFLFNECVSRVDWFQFIYGHVQRFCCVRSQCSWFLERREWS